MSCRVSWSYQRLARQDLHQSEQYQGLPQRLACERLGVQAGASSEEAGGRM